MGSPENKRKRHFNPRSPHGERQKASSRAAQASDISIHAPRTGSDVTTRLSRSAGCCISIHAPRTGSDVRFTLYYMILIYISIHAPRTGSDNAAPH